MNLFQSMLSNGIQKDGQNSIIHASTILKELKSCTDKTKKYFKDKTYVPDSYKVYLSAKDLSDFEPFLKALKQELADELTGYIQAKGYRITSGRVEVIFEHRVTFSPGQWKIGYRFRKTASENDTASRQSVRLKIVSAGMEQPPVQLGEGSYLMGRSCAADIEIPAEDLSVSKRHCRLIIENNRLFVRDLGSTNGTFVNGHPVSGLFSIKPGDRVGMGNTEVDIRR